MRGSTVMGQALVYNHPQAVHSIIMHVRTLYSTVMPMIINAFTHVTHTMCICQWLAMCMPLQLYSHSPGL